MLFCGGDGLGHGEEVVTKDSVVRAELNQLHELAATHLGVVDASLRRAIVVTCTHMVAKCVKSNAHYKFWWMPVFHHYSSCTAND